MVNISIADLKSGNVIQGHHHNISYSWQGGWFENSTKVIPETEITVLLSLPGLCCVMEQQFTLLHSSASVVALPSDRSPTDVINHWSSTVYNWPQPPTIHTHTVLTRTNPPRVTTLSPVLHHSLSTCEAPFPLAHCSLSSAKCCFEINTWEAHSARWCNNRGGLLLPRYRETVEKTRSQILLSLSPRPSGLFASIRTKVFCTALLEPVCRGKKEIRQTYTNSLSILFKKYCFSLYYFLEGTTGCCCLINLLCIIFVHYISALRMQELH